jgi:signal transduction histidine kinase
VSVLDAAIVAAALLIVGLLVVAIRLTSTTLDRNTEWGRSIGQIERSVALAYAWGETERARGARREAEANARAAATECGRLLQAVDGSARSPLRHLCDGVRSFRELAPGRLGGSANARTAYDEAFASTLRRADAADHAVAIAIADRRRTINRIAAGLVLLVVLVFAAMAVVVARRGRQLSAHNERLRRLDRLKDTFIAAVSHELRTPLTSTIGALQTIERKDMELADDVRDDMLTMAREQAERLARLVDELLFFSEVESGGQLRLSPTTVDYALLVNEAAEAALPRAKERGVALRLVADDIPPLRGDRGRLAQLLAQLIGNAIKFTDAGGSVDVRAGVEDGRAVVEVSDTGSGIPADEQRHLFERFFRSRTAVQQAVPGTGIGLSIVKAIVDAHNGRVTIESEEGRGTTVRVELPLPAQESGSSAVT